MESETNFKFGEFRLLQSHQVSIQNQHTNYFHYLNIA